MLTQPIMYKFLLFLFISSFSFGQDTLIVSTKRVLQPNNIGGRIVPLNNEKIPDILIGYPSFIHPDSMWCGRIILDREQYWYNRSKEDSNLKEYFLKSLNDYEIDTTQLLQSNSTVSFVFVFIGLHQGKKYIIIDSNNNFDFADENIDVHLVDSNEFDPILNDPRNQRIHVLNYDRVIGKNIIKQKNYIRIQPNNHLYNYKDKMSEIKTVYQYNSTITKAEFSFNNIGYEVFALPINSLALKESFENVHFLFKITSNEINFGNQIKFGTSIKLNESVFNILDYNFGENTITLTARPAVEKDFGWQEGDYLAKDILSEKVWQKAKEKRYTFLNFWGSWCGPCIEEIPDLKQFHSEFKELINLENYSIEKDQKGTDKAKDIVEKKQLAWSQSYLLFGDSQGIDDLLNINNFPMLIAIDTNGKILARESGLGNIERVKIKLGL